MPRRPNMMRGDEGWLKCIAGREIETGHTVLPLIFFWGDLYFSLRMTFQFLLIQAHSWMPSCGVEV